MFVLCPHCQFLIALDPASGRPPARCPRCARDLRAPAGAQAAVNSLPPAAGDVGLVKSDALAAAEGAAIADPVIVTGAATSEPITTATEQPDASTEPILEPELHVATASVQPADVAEMPMPEAVVGVVEAGDASASAQVAPGPVSAARSARRNARSVPSFVRAGRSVPVPGRRRWLRVGAIAGLTLLLGLQLLLADRARLAADARWRPVLTLLCGALRCSLPPWREPSAFTLLQRDVRPHPTVPGALRVTATFRNDARWRQPWPALLLTLSDLDGRSAGARAFVAREYLGAAPTRSGLASGQSATIAMDIVEPAPRIVAFTFDFR